MVLNPQDIKDIKDIKVFHIFRNVSTMNTQQAQDFGKLLSFDLAGRDSELSAFQARCEQPTQTSPLVICGPAGIGKSALVRAFEVFARELGWRVVAETAVRGLVERLRGTFLPALHESLEGDSSSVAQVAFSDWSLVEQVHHLSSVLAERGAGLLITLDSVARGAVAHMRELVDAVERVQRQGGPVQLVLAGRTAELREVLTDSGMGYLAEAERFELDALTRAQTEQVLRRELALCPALSRCTDAVLSDEVVARACAATHGYPSMVRLVAECIRQVATHSLTERELDAGVATAQKRLGSAVLDPLLAKLSAGDCAFLQAMAQDDGPSQMSAIAARLGKNPQYVGVYRNRLVEAQIIRSASYGKVTFVIPHLREHLRSVASGAEDRF